MSQEHLPPSQLVEEFELPVGVVWAGRTYKKAALRAEKVGDRESIFDEMIVENPDLLSDAGDEIRIGAIELAARLRVRRIDELVAEDGDELTGPTLRQALAEGLYPADGEALFEADVRLGEKLPVGSEPSAPSGPSTSASDD